jgi:hypothetical protein
VPVAFFCRNFWDRWNVYTWSGFGVTLPIPRQQRSL